jgi:hypothetical protein
MIVLPPFHGILAPAGGAFDPLSLSPALWLDASDQTRVFDATTGGSLPADGGAIARMVSKEGNNYAFTQATLANRPLRRAANVNGLDIAEYNGSTSALGISNSTMFSGADALTLFLVVRHNWTGLARTTFGISSQSSGTANPRFTLGWTTANRMTVASRRDDADSASTFSPTNTFPSGYFLTRIAINYQAQTISVGVNGITWGSQSSFGTAGTSDPDPANTIRAGSLSSGGTPLMDFGAAIAFRRILNGAEIGNLETYLLTRYGIS